MGFGDVKMLAMVGRVPRRPAGPADLRPLLYDRRRRRRPVAGHPARRYGDQAARSGPCWRSPRSSRASYGEPPHLVFRESVTPMFRNGTFSTASAPPPVSLVLRCMELVPCGPPDCYSRGKAMVKRLGTRTRLTLIELMIAVALGLIVMGMAIGGAPAMLKTSRADGGLAELASAVRARRASRRSATAATCSSRSAPTRSRSRASSTARRPARRADHEHVPGLHDDLHGEDDGAPDGHARRPHEFTG